MPVEDPLRSKLFFLDTQTYMARNFQFDYGVLERLQSHLEEDDCHLLITDVNVREIRRHLKRKAGEAVIAINKVKKEAMILRNTSNLSWHAVFDTVSSEQIYAELERKFNSFLENDRVEIIPTRTVNIDAVFDAYFNELPPFATTGKKAEFPDAFVLNAVNSISKQRGHKLYVVSEDRDVKSFCAVHDNLISIARLEELLALVLKNSERLAEPAKFADEIYTEFEPVIKQRIQEKLDEAEFELDDDFSEVEVNHIDVEKIEYLSRNLVDVSKEGATFEVMVRVSVIANISIPDYDRSPWDSEDKYHPFVFHNKIVRRYIHSAPITIYISFDDGVAANADIAEIETGEVADLSSAKIEELSFREMDFSDEE